MQFTSSSKQKKHRASSKHDSLFGTLVSSVLSIFIILCRQPFILFGILGWPSTWWDVFNLDLDMATLIREGRYIEIFLTWLAMVRPTIPGKAPEFLRSYAPLIAWLVYSDEAKVYVVGERKTYLPTQSEVGTETVLYVNGICTTKRIACTAGEEVGKIFNSKVRVVHNPTDSALVDLIECVIDKLWTGRSWITTEPSGLLEVELRAALLDKQKKKVILVAHSQGTIIACDVLWRLWEEIDKGHMSQAVMKKLEIYNFANCGHVMHQRDGAPYIENISNQADNVAMLGAAAPPGVKRLWKIDIDGKEVLPSTRTWGHLLLAHYLKPLWDGDYGDSRLYSYIAGSRASHFQRAVIA